MGTLSEKKLIEMLMEIQSDIRQIKYDVQLLLKQQPQTAPAHSPNSEDTAEFIDAGARSRRRALTTTCQPAERHPLSPDTPTPFGREASIVLSND